VEVTLEGYDGVGWRWTDLTGTQLRLSLAIKPGTVILWLDMNIAGAFVRTEDAISHIRKIFSVESTIESSYVAVNPSRGRH